MKNFLIAGAVVVALGLIPSAARAACTQVGWVVQVRTTGATTVYLRTSSPGTVPVILFTANTANLAHVMTLNTALAGQGRIQITGNALTCPPPPPPVGSMGLITSIIYPF